MLKLKSISTRLLINIYKLFLERIFTKDTQENTSKVETILLSCKKIISNLNKHVMIWNILNFEMIVSPFKR